MSGLRYSYITNGLSDHRLEDALVMLADQGYSGVGLTLDHHHLDPFAPDVVEKVTNLSRRLESLRLGVVVETGGRFVLDPLRKHEPTLLSEDGRQRRVDFLVRAVEIASDLGAEAMSFWSGRRQPEVAPDVAWQRLINGCRVVLETAERRDVQLAFEPEPGMFLETIEQAERLRSEFDDDPRLGLTLDIGHCHCIEDQSVADCIRRVGSSLRNVHIEDMKRGVHDHLDFGEGTMQFPPIMAALNEIEYRGLVSVELSRHSHTAHLTVPRSLKFLKGAERAAMEAP